jgi:hypothetical protein
VVRASVSYPVYSALSMRCGWAEGPWRGTECVRQDDLRLRSFARRRTSLQLSGVVVQDGRGPIEEVWGLRWAAGRVVGGRWGKG